MTKEEVIAQLKALGIDVSGLKDEALAKAQAWLDAQKAGLDTETRRKVRAFWGPVGFVVGLVAGFFLHALIG